MNKQWHRDRIDELESNKDVWQYARNIYVPGLIGFVTLFIYIFGSYVSENNLPMMVTITLFGILMWVLLDEFYSSAEKNLAEIDEKIEHNYDVLLNRPKKKK